MVYARGMTGKAECAAGHQLSHRRLRMALRTSGVGVGRCHMRLADLHRPVAIGAPGIDGMVIVVAGYARRSPRIGLERHRRSVALDALEPHVFRVLEYYRSRPGCMIGDRHSHCQRATGIHLA